MLSVVPPAGFEPALYAFWVRRLLPIGLERLPLKQTPRLLQWRKVQGSNLRVVAHDSRLATACLASRPTFQRRERDLNPRRLMPVTLSGRARPAVSRHLLRGAERRSAVQASGIEPPKLKGGRFTVCWAHRLPNACIVSQVVTEPKAPKPPQVSRRRLRHLEVAMNSDQCRNLRRAGRAIALQLVHHEIHGQHSHRSGR